MYEKTKDVLIKGKELEVLEPFCADYRTRFHARQLAALLKMNHATAALTLKRLENKAVLKSGQEGRNKKYCLNLDNFLAKKYIENAESARAMKYFERHFIIKKMLSEFVPSVFREVPVILFGSYAKESYNSESDMDILILNIDKKNIMKSLSEFGKRHNKKIHIQMMSQKDFEKGLIEKDALVLEIARNHIILNNIPLIVGVFWRYYNAIR